MSELFWHLNLTSLPGKNYCTVFGHIGPSPIHPDTWFQHFCLPEIIIAQCPDTLSQVRSIQTPDSNILAYQKLLQIVVQTHFADIDSGKHPIYTIWSCRNIIYVSRYILLSRIQIITQLAYYSLLKPIPWCPDTCEVLSYCQYPIYIGFHRPGVNLNIHNSFHNLDSNSNL